jgi:hypothetical protein
MNSGDGARGSDFSAGEPMRCDDLEREVKGDGRRVAMLRAEACFLGTVSELTLDAVSAVVIY